VILLRGSVAVLSKQAAASQMVPHLTERFRVEFGYSPSRSEVLSWERSIPPLLGQLSDVGLDEVEVLVEYQLPRYSGRADVVLLGEHPKGGPSCVVVENKQWSRVALVDIEHRLVTVPGVPGQERLHPQAQVCRYTEHLRDFNCYLGKHGRPPAGCVYLHNATSGGIAGLRHPNLADLATFPAFAGDEVAGLRAFLTSRLAPVSGAQVADDFLRSKIAPSKQLLEHVRGLPLIALPSGLVRPRGTGLEYSQGCPLVIHSSLRPGLSRPAAGPGLALLVADRGRRVSFPRTAGRG